MKQAPKRLSMLLPDAGSAAELSISGIALDSRKVVPGNVFVACRGTRSDGHQFIDDAIARGAVAVVVDRQVETRGVPVVTVADSRRSLASMAAHFYDDPSQEVKCIGVTGTNGKTSVAHYVGALLNGAGIATGVGGTLGFSFGAMQCRGGLTTEDAVALQAKLAEMKRLGARRAVLEVSSHALDQHRAEGVAFDTAVFTNLTRDHLDYHVTMDAYGAAKARLFQFASVEHAIVNLDDPFGKTLLDRVRPGARVIRYGFANDADVRISDGRQVFSISRTPIEIVLARPPPPRCGVECSPGPSAAADWDLAHRHTAGAAVVVRTVRSQTASRRRSRPL
ncbi:MAG: UDP-N-acetylmuramyl-tripeptide synthetase [Gammaproteobacteria bacterium]|nr:UDP-N-acetylmuramyl-tripeptide synthetase [Gammaproteobacteria bacterium]